MSEILKPKICITMDTDWASDFVLEDTMNLLAKMKIPVSVFATHDSPVIQNILSDSNYEVGLHPNYTILLNGNSNTSSLRVIQELKEMFPDAISVRSHSLVHSSQILKESADIGLKYDVNLFIPIDAGIRLHPFYDISGLIRVPYCWADDVWCYSQGDDEDVFTSIKNFDIECLLVLNFHPIHVFLNTENISRYERSKAFINDRVQLASFVNKGYGIRNILMRVVEKARELEYDFSLIKEIKI